MTIMHLRAALRLIAFTSLAIALLITGPRPGTAGDFAERTILGFSPDGRHFAFEQFGVQDGSGFPYADIFVIDIGQDKWVAGSPFRVLLEDETKTVEAARRDVLAMATGMLSDLAISRPGHILASNPPAELSADPHRVTVNPSFQLLGVREPWEFKLAELPLPLPRCADLLGKPAKGFRLSLTPYRGSNLVLHEDRSIPKSRGCPMSYAFSDVVMYEPERDKRVFVVLLSLYSFGFEGPDRRFIAVPYIAN